MGNQPNAGELVLGQLRASLDGSRYSLTAVYAAVTLAFGGAVVILLFILALWYGLREVYATKPLLAARLRALKQQGEKSNDRYNVELPKLRECLETAYNANESEIAEAHGLDAAVYLRSLRMMRNIFALLTLILFFTAAPINIVFNMRAKFVDNLTKRDALMLLTPTLLSSKQLIPHVVLGWVTNSVVMGLLWYNYTRVLAMRRTVFSHPEFERQIMNRTVLLTDIPKNMRSTEGVARVLAHANPRAASESIAIGRNPSSELREMLDLHHNKVLQLEREILSSGGSSISSSIGTSSVFGIQSASRKSSLVSEAVTMRSEKSQKISQKLMALERNIDAHRASAVSNAFMVAGYNSSLKKPDALSSYGFAAFSSHKDAVTTARNGKSHSLESGVRLRLAPPPEHLVWSNLGLSAAERGTKQLLMNTLYGVLLILWIVPSAFIGCFLANLSRLASVWPAFGGAMQQNPIGFAILQGILAPFVTTLVFASLPVLFRRFSHLQGKVTKVEREREVLRKLYAFFFLDNYFLFTIMGVIWDIIAQVLQQTQAARNSNHDLTFQEVWDSLRVAQRIATAIVNLSSFWVLYLLRSIFALFIEVSQPITLLTRLGQKLNFIQKPTPRERALSSMPQPFQYAVGFLGILFNATIALGFTTIQPLVLPVTLILFTLAFPLRKYTIIHMQITKYESHGMFWPLVCDLTLFALALGNLVLLCVVWVQAGWQIAVAVCPLIASVIVFKIVLIFKLDKKFMYPSAANDQQQLLQQNNQFLALEKGRGVVVDSEEEPRLCELYEDPAWHTPLDKPLLTFEEALCHVADPKYYHEQLLQQKTSQEMAPMDQRSGQSSGSSSRQGSVVELYEQPNTASSIGAVWQRGLHQPYSPVELWPSNEHFAVNDDNSSIYPEISSHHPYGRTGQDSEQNLLR